MIFRFLINESDRLFKDFQTIHNGQNSQNMTKILQEPPQTRFTFREWSVVVNTTTTTTGLPPPDQAVIPRLE